MKIYEEKRLADFQFWSGAKRAEILTDEQFDTIESLLESEYPDGVEDTFINDLFWFEPDTIAEWLGFTDWEALERHNNGEEDEEDEEDEEA